MIAADTSTWSAFLQGEPGHDTELLDDGLKDQQLVMVPVVLTEVLSDPGLPPQVAEMLAELPLLDIDSGFWRRAARLRAAVLKMGRKARLGDALIAQCCIDHGIPLITRDRDFRIFAESAGLKLPA
ncbi:MAG: PIN domain-containing protein [Terriglobales bacterium]|jgi:predicted nucleic acid-binding protein